MAQVILVCEYCDHQWKAYVYEYAESLPKCPKCKDKNIKLVKTKDFYKNKKD